MSHSSSDGTPRSLPVESETKEKKSQDSIDDPKVHPHDEENPDTSKKDENGEEKPK